MRKLLYAIIPVLMACAGLGTATPAASAAAGPPGLQARSLSSIPSAVNGFRADTVPVSGHICSGKVGGGCWWETAIQFWYYMKQGISEKNNLASVYKEYNGNFQDTWTDDNAWWGITWELAYQDYHVASYNTLAHSLWTWDTTKGWDTKCGGSTLQHPGGTEDDISRAALGVLASAIGNSGSAQRAAAWIFQYMQGSNPNNPAAENINSSCVASGSIAQLGGQTESWKIEQLTGGAGQPGTKTSATAQYPEPKKIYNGQFNLLYDVYIG
jgi:hypothetical protein